MTKIYLNAEPKTLEEYLSVLHGKSYFNLDEDLDKILIELFADIEVEYHNSNGDDFIVNDIEFIDDSVLLHLYHSDYQSSVAHDMDYIDSSVLVKFRGRVRGMITVISSLI